MDGKEFVAPGTCPACGMTLVSKREPTSTLPFEPATIKQGSGAFLVAGAPGRTGKRIMVHHFMPRRYSAASPILLVVPGSGRNSDAYRDAWVEASDRFGVLVAALSYQEKDYDLAAYQMGGVIKNLRISNTRLGPDGQLPSILHLRDEDISFEIEPDRNGWLFADLDRIFKIVANAAGSSRDSYDLFGHSAGGQILHRAVLFHPALKADRIVAANTGLYTLPNLDEPPIFGLKGTGMTPDSLATSFSRNLTIMLGGNDNDPERGGNQLHTPLADRQGYHRLARGHYFFEAGQKKARSMGVAFNWQLKVIPGVGHEYKEMGRAAAQYLYG
jgi:hypothetical protein